jgi:hypothetical protein
MGEAKGLLDELRREADRHRGYKCAMLMLAAVEAITILQGQLKDLREKCSRV